MHSIKKEKKLFETDTADKEDEFDFDISMLKPLEEEEEEIIDFDISSLKPIDDTETQHKGK